MEIELSFGAIKTDVENAEFIFLPYQLSDCKYRITLNIKQMKALIKLLEISKNLIREEQIKPHWIRHVHRSKRLKKRKCVTILKVESCKYAFSNVLQRLYKNNVLAEFQISPSDDFDKVEEFIRHYEGIV